MLFTTTIHWFYIDYFLNTPPLPSVSFGIGFLIYLQSKSFIENKILLLIIITLLVSAVDGKYYWMICFIFSAENINSQIKLINNAVIILMMSRWTWSHWMLLKSNELIIDGYSLFSWIVQFVEYLYIFLSWLSSGNQANII